MDPLFSKDKFTKSNYNYTQKNAPETINLSNEDKKSIEDVHKHFIDTLPRLLSNYNFDKQLAPPRRSQFKLNDLEQAQFFENALIKFSIKSEQVNVLTLGSESPFHWFVLESNKVRYSNYLLEIQLKNAFEYPVKWLIDQQLILYRECKKCKQQYRTYRSVEDRYEWFCNNFDECTTESFELVGWLKSNEKILTEIPKIIFNWSIYSNAGQLKHSKTNKNLDSQMVRLVIESIRQVCQQTNDSYKYQLGENGQTVELMEYQASNLFFIIAFQVDTPQIKFKILTEDIVAQIFNIIRDWISPSARLIVYEKKFEILKMHFTNFEFRKSFNSKSNELVSYMTNMIARNILSGQLDPIVFSSFLHEIIWRIIFGRTPFSAFFSIIDLIRKVPFKDENQLEPLSKAENGILVDEIYFGNFSKNFKPNRIAELRNNIRCHLCFIPFNFISLNNHMMSHFKITSKVSGKTAKGLIDTTCYHCFQKFSFTDLQKHRDLLIGSYKKRKNLFNSCKICCKTFSTREEYIDHLKETHKQQDHPYSCEQCPFRTSFYHEKVNHLKNYHSDTLKAYCKFCLKIFTDDDASEHLFNHFKQHLSVRNQFQCNHCALLFVNQQEFSTHFIHDHIIQEKKAPNFTTTRYKPTCSEQNNSFKVRLTKSLPSSKIPLQKKTRDNRQIKLTKKNSFKLIYECVKHDNVSKKNFIQFDSSFLICLECCQPIDTNHFSRQENRCDHCGYISYCSTSVKYPCTVHFSGAIKPEYEKISK